VNKLTKTVYNTLVNTGKLFIISFSSGSITCNCSGVIFDSEGHVLLVLVVVVVVVVVPGSGSCCSYHCLISD